MADLLSSSVRSEVQPNDPLQQFYSKSTSIDAISD